MRNDTFTFFFVFFIVFFSISLFACSKESPISESESKPKSSQYQAWTQAEIDLIMSGEANEPMRILLTSIEEDSLFLRKNAIPIKPDANDPVLTRLRERMLVTMNQAGGVGLAGPQVGIGRDVFFCKRFDLENQPVQFIINPVVIFYSVRTAVFPFDGCLSMPHYTGPRATRRHTSIFVEYYTQDGIKEKNILEGTSSTNFTSVCFQHEFDHLRGVLFPDRLNVQ